MAKLRVKRALQLKVPPSADAVYQPGDKVLVWREKIVLNRIGEWLGPFTVILADRQRKLVYVQDCEIGPARPFGYAQVKAYISPHESAQTFFSELHTAFAEYRSDTDETAVMLTEVISNQDPRASAPEMAEAKRAEIRGLLERGTFKVILREEIPKDANVLPGRFVMSIKSSEDGEVKWKARYVIGGYRDRLKHLMVHTTQTLQPSSVRLLLALAAIHGFKVWTSDVRQAYLQSSHTLSREVFIRNPVAEFELNPEQCLQLLKPLYGLCESGDLWHKTLDDHHRRVLKMSPMRSDPALYVRMANGLLDGLSGCYVDDMIRSGQPAFQEAAKVTSNSFEMAEDEFPPCTFTGFKLDVDEDGVLEVNQHEYQQKLSRMPEDGSYRDFCSKRMQLAWLAHSRPDVLYEVSQLTQVTQSRFEENRRDVIKATNRVIGFVKENAVAVRFPKLELSSLRVVGISDASFATNYDSSSQLGYIVLIADAKGRAIPIFFKSYKARRVTRSVMGAELIAFSQTSVSSVLLITSQMD